MAFTSTVRPEPPAAPDDRQPPGLTGRSGARSSGDRKPGIRPTLRKVTSMTADAWPPEIAAWNASWEAEDER